MTTEFTECDACRAKPGSPPLCAGCLRNREAIQELNRQLTGKGLTPRGFEDFARFRDSHGSVVTVRESSQIGGPYVWVFCTSTDALAESGRRDATPHLDAEQARDLAQALMVFVRKAEEEE